MLELHPEVQDALRADRSRIPEKLLIHRLREARVLAQRQRSIKQRFARLLFLLLTTEDRMRHGREFTCVHSGPQTVRAIRLRRSPRGTCGGRSAATPGAGTTIAK